MLINKRWTCSLMEVFSFLQTAQWWALAVLCKILSTVSIFHSLMGSFLIKMTTLHSKVASFSSMCFIHMFEIEILPLGSDWYSHTAPCCPVPLTSENLMNSEKAEVFRFLVLFRRHGVVSPSLLTPWKERAGRAHKSLANGAHWKRTNMSAALLVCVKEENHCSVQNLFVLEVWRERSWPGLIVPVCLSCCYWCASVWESVCVHSHVHLWVCVCVWTYLCDTVSVYLGFGGGLL